MSPTTEAKKDPAAKAIPRRSQAKALLRRCGSGLFLFVLLYNLLFRVVVAPLGRLLWTGALRLSPQSFFLMGSDAHDLFKSPLLLAAGLVLGIGYAFWALYEIAGILLYLDCAVKGEKISLPALMARALRRLAPVLQPKNLPLLLFAGVVVPFTDVVMVGDFISQLSLPAYIMEVVQGQPLYFGAFVILLVLLVLWTVAWLFVFHRFLIEKEDLPTAARASLRLVRGRVISGPAGLLLYRVLVRVRYTIFAALGLLLFMAGMFLLQDSVPNALAAGQLTNSYLLTPLFRFICHCFITFAQWSYLTVLYREATAEDAGTPAAPLPKPKFHLRALPLLMVALFAATGGLGTGVFLLLSQDNDALQELLDPRVEISAHRGHSAVAPENTLPAFQAAIDCGVADYGELDVQQTSDGVVVLTHDTNLKRCTGRDVNIYDITYAELQTLDASKGYTGPGSFAGTKIPTLDEVIKLCKGKIKLNIEIKQNGHAPTLEEEVVRIIQENGFEDECVITSLNYQSLEKVDEIAPDLPCGYILAVGVGSYYDLPAADFFSVETTFVTASMVDAIHMRGKTVHSWTVDRVEDANRLANLGVDNLITGQPEVVYKALTAQRDEVRELQDLPGLRTLWAQIQTMANDAANLTDELTQDSATPETAADDADAPRSLERILEAA